MSKNQYATSQMEFLAEDTLLTILPHFRIKENRGYLHFISGDFGPFIPSTPVEVPMWLALTLKKRHLCSIKPPEWLSVEYLSSKLDQEKNSDFFQEAPYHFLEISSMLFECSSDDIPDVEKDIENIRQDKIRNGLQKIANDVQSGGTAYAVQMNNVASLEINSVRHFMVETLNKFYLFSDQSNANLVGESQVSSSI